jgi:hypothetical protein
MRGFSELIRVRGLDGDELRAHVGYCWLSKRSGYGWAFA